MFVRPPCSIRQSSGASHGGIGSTVRWQRVVVLRVVSCGPAIAPSALLSCPCSERRREEAMRLCNRDTSCSRIWRAYQGRRVSRSGARTVASCLKSALAVLHLLETPVERRGKALQEASGDFCSKDVEARDWLNSLTSNMEETVVGMEDERGEDAADFRSLGIQARVCDSTSASSPTSTSRVQSKVEKTPRHRKSGPSRAKEKARRIRREEAEIIKILFASSREKQSGNGAAIADVAGSFVSAGNGDAHKAVVRKGKGREERVQNLEFGAEKRPGGIQKLPGNRGKASPAPAGNGSVHGNGNEEVASFSVKGLSGGLVKSGEGGCCESCSGVPDGPFRRSFGEGRGDGVGERRDQREGENQRWQRGEETRGMKQDVDVERDLTLPADGGLLESIMALGGDDHVKQMLDTWPREVTRSQIAAVVNDLAARMRLEQAVEVFEWAQASGGAVRPGAPLHGLMVRLLARARMLSTAEKVFSAMRAQGLAGGRPGLRAHNAMLSAYQRAGSHADARALFDRMVANGPKPDVVSCSLMLALAVAEGRAASYVRALAREMEAAHVLEIDTRMLNVVLTAIRRDGLWEDVPEMLEEMCLRGCGPDEVTYNTVLALYGTCARPREARDALERMRAEGLRPGVRAYTGLVKAYANAGKMSKALQVVREMEDRDSLRPDLHLWSLLVSVHGRSGHPHEGEALLEHMRAAGCAPNAVTYGTLVHAYGRQCMPHEAARVFKEMCARGVAPDLRCYNALIAAFGREGLSLHAEHFFQDMHARHIAPDRASYNILLRAFYQAGRVQDAEVLHDAMLKANLTPDGTTKRMAVASSSNVLLCNYEQPPNQRGVGSFAKDR